ncbi:hypothetical protein FJR45_10215 [Sulfurimonas sediminis]|uniref:DUF11 domain-containing protein n=1 Tax=Sulfurimonas sediminis TaxID=2590020 RepID=A0A7M1B3R2_9BACT|nr:hypothetical protein [Sulfurimonas sediminis]QOP44295.1 hypothetical protein FJR45_10215 [Sulfurimonas sediminis]
MNLLYKTTLLFSLINYTIYAAEVQFQNTTPYATEVYGDIKLIGNTILRVDTNNNKETDEGYFLSDDQTSYGLGISNGQVQYVWANGWTNVSNYDANNFSYMKYIDVDNDNSTKNSSSSTLTIPANSEVIYARLYWSGMIHNFADGSSIDTQLSASKSVKLKIADGNYISITTTTDGYDSTEGWTEIAESTNATINGENLNYSRYSAYKDITQQFTNLDFNGSSITVTVADVASTEGWMRNYGNYGAWSIAVVYRNTNETYKHISLYSGYEEVYSNTIDINISGFLTPKSSNVVSTISVFAVEGEKTTEFGQDYLKVADTSGNLIDVTNNTAYPNSKTNIFDSTITNNEIRNPDIPNTMGIDIDTFSIGADGDTAHPQIIQNNQTSTKIELSSGGDAYTVDAIALSTELYVPTFCYDYAYKQDNRYFTEDNDGTKDPSIIGNVSTNSPIEVTIFLRNLVDSDINVTDMQINVLDINTTQAPYIDSTTKLAQIGDLIPKTVDANSSGDSYIQGVSIGTMQANDYFYFYYQLDPKTSNINMPINFTAQYNITSAGTTIPYLLKLAKEIPMCSGSAFEYTPTSGIFNIVHKNYYNDNTQYYNLPTQVIKREGRFEVIALDPNNYDTLKPQSTIVAVEAIDAGAFHNTDASCFEQYNFITDREWVVFENNVSIVDFTPPTGFFKEVRENSAFRVSLNLTNEGSDSLVNISMIGADQYTINNYNELLANLSSCSQSVEVNGNSTNDINTACGTDGAIISKTQLKSCMECIYGYNTKYICSRDNFSLRPEAFSIKFNDQNQTTSASLTRIADNISGVSSPSESVLNLSSGYNYNLEINATSYADNEPSVGYTKTFNISSSDTFEYKWEPRNVPDTSGCNDTANKKPVSNLRFLNGVIDQNTSVNQVGEYRLYVKDTTWTSVDNNPIYMNHHIGSHFLNANIPDCIKDSDIVQNPSTTTNALPLNGCTITSNHTNSNLNIKYRDYNITFHPYKFDLNAIAGGTAVTPTIGLLFTPVPSTTPYIYMADINNTLDENMSYHLNGSITALGENNVALTNFVDKCYAVPLDINISTSNRDLNDSNGDHVDYKVRFHDINSSGEINTTLDITLTESNATQQSDDILIQTTKEYFFKNLNGTMQTHLNMNYVRKKETAVNPTTLTFIKYQVNCTNAAADCTFNADLVNNKTTKGVKDLNSTIPIRHYYGRTHAPRQTIVDTDGNISLFYEIYCYGNDCNKTLLPNGTNSNSTDDPRWFINTQHTAPQDGTPGTITQKNSAGAVTVGTLTNNTGITLVPLTYDGTKGYPYKTTMENNASSWLIYNKYNANATKNEFQVEFVSSNTDWAGVHETNTTTLNNASDTTSRRLMW